MLVNTLTASAIYQLIGAAGRVRCRGREALSRGKGEIIPEVHRAHNNAAVASPANCPVLVFFDRPMSARGFGMTAKEIAADVSREEVLTSHCLLV